MCDGLSNGFSQTVLSFGQVSTGKTTRLLGKHAWPALQLQGEMSLLGRVLKRLLSKGDGNGRRLMVGISCWELVHSKVSSLSATWRSHAADSLQQALQKGGSGPIH